jgi:predicted RNase H-like nuclease
VILAAFLLALETVLIPARECVDALVYERAMLVSRVNDQTRTDEQRYADISRLRDLSGEIRRAKAYAPDQIIECTVDDPRPKT